LAEELTQRRAELAGRRARLSLAKRASLEDQINISLGSNIPDVIPRRRSDLSQVLPSFAQQRLWFLDQLDSGKPTYNMPLAVRLTGELRVFALEQNVGEVMRRHEGLRTTFVAENGQPLQLIGPPSPFVLQTVDLGGLHQGAIAEVTERLSSEEAQRSFDLARGPLLRTTLIRSGRVEHALLLTVHHIVSDGWSMGLLVSELGEVYRAYSSGEPSTLAELQIQYGDYACWQRQWLRGAVLEGELNYWRWQLDGAPSLLELPSDRPRPAVQTFRGGSHLLALSSALSESLRALCRKEETTLFMTMLAAFQILLSRWTGERDIVVGTPVAGRRWVETEGLIGLFVNTLVLRTKFSESTRVQDMLALVREVVLEAQTHQELPFEKLVEELQPQRSLSHAPLFQVMFILQNAPPGAVRVEELTFHGIDFKLDSAKFDLTISVVEGRENLVCGLTYNRDMFEETTIRRMASQWEEVMKGVVRDPHRLISEIAAMSEHERHQIVVEWNDTRRRSEETRGLADIFEDEVERKRDAVAVTCGGEALSFGELNGRANQLAHYLSEMGVRREAVVGVCLERSVDMIAGLLAILKTGAAYLPLDPIYPKERLAFMLRDAQGTMVLTQYHLVERLPNDIGPLCLDTDWNLIERHPDHNPPGGTTAGDLAYIIYTSGSTGQPRGVKVEHGSVVNLLLALERAIYKDTTDSQLRVSLNGSLAFDTSVKQLIQLLRGHTLVIVPEEVRYSGEALLSFCANNSVDVLDCTPSILRDLISEGLLDRADIGPSLVLVGGEAIEGSMWQALAEDKGISFVNLYGPTECTVDSTTSRITAELSQPVIGRPLANVQAYVLDHCYQTVPVNVPGELSIGGVGVACGYHQRPDLTAEKFIPDSFGGQPGARLYMTGDKTRYLQDATLQYLGRLDHQVKVRGHRIEPAEIESALVQLPFVSDCAVISKPDYLGNNRLVAYVVLQKEAAEPILDIKNHLRRRLPEYMVPSVVVKVEEMPLTPNGKVDRGKLTGLEVKQERVEGKEERERKLVEEVIGGIWGEVLGIEGEIRLSDNFFEIGGHSLLATQVVSRMREAFGVEVALRAIFEEPELEGLSRIVEKQISGGGEEEWKKIGRAARDEALPLSYAQTRLWFLDQLEPGNWFYNVPMGVRIEGGLNVKALEESVRQMVRRHEPLRTVINNEGRGPVQVIQEEGTIRIGLIDLSEMEEQRRGEEVRRMSEAEAREPFELSKGPLIRFTVIKETSERHVLLVTMHHVISDGWSMGVLVREVTEIYEAGCEGRPVELEELAIQYADYAVWQREYLSGERLESETRYWRRQLEGAPEVVELPTDRPRPAVQTYRGGEEQFEVRRGVVRGLRQLGRRESATLFMTMMAAFKVLLYRWSGQKDTLVGTPIANRNRAELEGIIGFFVNTLVIRSELEPEESLASVVRKVRETSIGAYAHQDLPFEKLVEEMRPNRSLSYNPVFQVMMLLQNAGKGGGVEVSGLKMRAEGGSSGTSKFDLLMGIVERVEGLSIGITYNSDLYDRETVKRMCVHMGRILEEMGKGEGRAIRDVGLMSEEERQQVLVECNDTRRGGEERNSIVEMIEREVERRGDMVGIRFGEEEVSYGELNRRANQLAHYLRRKGIRVEELVVICMERSVEMVIGMIGVMKAGGAYVPLDPKYPRERQTMIEEDAGGGIILTEEELGRRLWGEGKEGVIRVDGERGEIRKESGENPRIGIRGENLAYVIYTSGSTGKAKGVGIEQRSVVELAEWAGEEYGEEGLRRVIATTSICFDLSIFEILVVLGRGGEVNLVRDVLEVEEMGGRGEGMVLNTVPSAAGELIRVGGIRGGIRTVNLAGEVLHRGLVEEVYKCKGVESVYNLYGPTEDTTYTTYAKVRRGEGERGPGIGRPIRNTEVYILDEGMEAVPIGVVGEIYIGGKGLARGYKGRGDLTAERFICNPYREGSRMYRTGDLGRRWVSGELEYLGRIDHQVKVRGFRIELGEIEAALKGEGEIEEAIVVAREESGGGKRLVAYITVKEGARISGDEVKAAIREKLPEYMVPSVVVKVEEMPLTPNGKVDRGKLTGLEVKQERVEGKEERERKLVEEVIGGIWGEVLGIEGEIRLSDNFFEIGGHSLLATQVVSRMREAFGVEVALRAIFEEPELEGLSRIVEKQISGGGEEEWKKIGRAARDEALPLSYAQTRLWFLDQLEPGNWFYNVPMGVRIEGGLNVKALEESVRQMVRRHEPLRTVINNEGRGPVQVIQEEGTIRIGLIDLSEMEEQRRGEEVRRMSEAEAREPFELSKGPLIRFTVIKETSERHVLLVTMHHVISDGWSMGVLVREVTEIYEAGCEGRPVELEELAIQYADYAVWQREYLSGERLESETRYWRRQLEGAPEVVELPTDRPRPAVQTYRGGEEQFEVRRGVVRGLRQLGRRESATLFMTMMAAFKVLLYRWSGQKDTLVGTPIANRNRAELEGIIGFFVNTLVIRSELEPEESLASVVRKVRETSIGAYAHQDLPFEKLVEEMRPNRSLSYNPVFQVMMLLQNAGKGGGVEVSGLKMRAEGGSSGTSKFDLLMGIVERVEGLSIGITYNSDLYDRETVKRMCVHMGRILEEMGKGEGRAIRDVGLMSEEERQQVLVECNDTRRGGEERNSIVEMIEREVERRGDMVGIRFGEEEVSYGELNRRANQLAHYLRRKGIRVEELVVICMERSVEMVIGMIGVMKAGGAYVPLDPKYPRERQTMIEEDAGGGIILTEEELGRRLWGEGKEGVIRVDGERGEIRKESGENPRIGIRGENLAYVIYTSGSTGKAKGVGIEQRSVVELAEWAGEEYGEEGLRRVIATTSICFDLSIFEILVVLGRGGEVNLVRDVLEVEEMGGRGEGMVLNTVPSAAGELIRVGGIRGGIRTVNLAGEVLHRGLVEEVYKCKGVESVYNLYGPTEDTTYTTYAKVRRGEGERGPGIGRPIRNTEVYILDEGMEAVPIGVVGEIYIGGKGLARGYKGRGDLTAERFICNPYREGSRMYRTGDLGRRWVSGELEYLGRIDHQVKVRGFRIELGEIEAALKGEGEIEEAIVVAREESGGGKRLVAYITVKEGARISGDEVKAAIREKLPEYMVPSVVVKVEEMPLTPNGKVDRHRLPEPGRGAVLEKQFIEPRDSIEQEVTRIWEEVLGIQPIGVTDNFFAFGGHSLLAVRLMSEIKKRFEIKLPLTTLFQEPTVEHIAGLLRSGTRTAAWSPLVKLQPLGSKPPFFCVHPAGGHVFCYAKLARRLGTERPFYGIQAQGLDGSLPPQTSVQAMAARYIEELRRIQPGGPFLLGGWSMGGVVAFEMARHLKSEGEDVALLALIDSKAPAGQSFRFLDADLLYSFALDLSLPPSALSPEGDDLSFTGQLSLILSLAKDAGKVSPEMTISAFRRFFEVFKTNFEAMRTYAPSTYAGRITLFRADGSPALKGQSGVSRVFRRLVSQPSSEGVRDQTLGWGQWAADGVECHGVPGSHYTIVGEPCVEALAERIRSCIEQAEAQDPK
jgi:amino acid adenylation domain-containing protein